MVKYSFKVGDRVKLRAGYIHVFRRQGTKVGTVIKVDGQKYIRVIYVGYKNSRGFPYRPNEIEHVAKVGEQLMFNFMTP